jgi:hypothetical protein
MSPHDLALRFFTKGEQDLAAARVLANNPGIADDLQKLRRTRSLE